MSAKQIRTHTPRWFITTIAHSGAKMGQYINGFITGLPKYLGKDCIYVVVDRLKKFAHLFDVTSYFNAAQVDYIFFKEILPPLDDEGQLTLVPENILNTRERKLRNRTSKEYLVQCKDIPSKDDTWEEENILQHTNLKLLEDKQYWVGRIVIFPFK